MNVAPVVHQSPVKPNITAFQGGNMTRWQRVPLDVQAVTATRLGLMARPLDFFREFFGGRIPTEQEKHALIEQSVQRMAASPTYRNNTYVVQLESVPPFIHLHIHRHDWAACNDWRHFQQIKNELVGSEHEAVELFPAESRLVDTSNTYHLWVHADPSFRFPLGLRHRLVTSEAIGLEQQRSVA